MAIIQSAQGSSYVPEMVEGLDYEKIRRRFLFMKNEANSWVPSWKELSGFINPTRGFFDGDIPNRGKKIDHIKVLDGAARRAVRTLASGMTSGLTSPSRPWFRVSVPDPDLADFSTVKIWCDVVRNRMLDVFQRSNTYGSLHSIYEEIASFGTAASFLQEDFNEVIRMRTYTIGEYFLSAGLNGRVNGFARNYWMTVDQMVEAFTLENCSDSVQDMYRRGDYDNWIKVNHMIQVNRARIQGVRIDNRNMAFQSLYWEEGQSQKNKWLKIGGYEDLPILGPRWDVTTTADVYGRGPGWDTLGDVKMLQKEQREKMMAIDLVNKPPMQADASVSGEVSQLPGGLTRSSTLVPNAGVRPSYQINPNIEEMRKDIADVKQAIKEGFYADLFLMLYNDQRGNMTATEIMERQSEKLQILGPVLEKLESELLTPLITRTFNIMFRNGMLPEPPPELRGMQLQIQYVSVLAQAQKMVGTTAIQQALNFTQGMMQAFPTVGDNIDTDEVVREYFDAVAVSPKLTFPKEKVAADRQARAAEMQKQQQQQQMLASAEAANKGAAAAKNLAQAPLGQNSALDSTLAAITGSNQS